jgi:phenylpropionate dioxygenase-like ring-hydroxylating dioxygenase large terminal subunit
MFKPETYAAVRLPVSRAATLPPYAYTSAEWYEREIQEVFHKQWIFVTRLEEIANPGDYVRVDLAGEPIIVVRDRERRVRAMSASCRHRGTEVAKGQGNCASFKCPYHGWSYSLTGELIGVPGMEGVEGFDRAQWGLVPIRAETWGGFVFVNLDPDSPPLAACMGDLPARLGSYRFEDMRVTKKWVNRVEANWKIWLENSREGYHVNVVHRETYRRFYQGRGDSNWRSRGMPGIYEILSGTNDDGLYLPRDPVFPLVEGLSQEDRESTHFVIFYPLLLLNVPPSHLAFHQLQPDGPHATTVTTWMCFPAGTVARADFEQAAGAYYQIPEMFIPEDKEACAAVQRGLRARLATAGRFSLEEKPCHEFANYLLDRLVGRPPA